jgi:hypothetical protein
LITIEHALRKIEVSLSLLRLSWILRILDRRQGRAASILISVGTIAIIALVFVTGLLRGLDHVAMFGPENEQNAITIALSDTAYHLNAGYLGYAAVHNKLVEIWNRGARNGQDPILLQNNSNRELLNEAISAAASLGPQNPAYVGNRTLITMLLTDVGSVDFFKIGFRIFGYKIEAAYYTFFLILIFSVVMYLLVFWNDVVPKLVLVCTIFAFYIEMHTAILTFNMPTFSSERHGSALALVPLWHFAFLIIYRYRASLSRVLATLVQLGIILLAIRIRGATTWVLLFIALLCVTVAFLDWRRLGPDRRSWRRMLRATMQWPFVLLAGGVLVNDQQMKASLHPIYFTDDVTPYHGIWMPALAGVILYAPELMPPNSKVNQVAQTMGIDTAVYTAGMEYLNDIAFLPLPPDYPLSVPPTLVSPWTGTYKFRLMDESVRHAMERLVRKHPLALLQLYLFKKPYYIVVAMGNIINWTPTWTWIWLLLLGGTGTFMMALRAGALSSFPLGRPLLAVFAAMPFAALGPMWAWATSYSLLDLALIVFIFLQLLLCGALVLLTRRLWVRWQSKAQVCN